MGPMDTDTITIFLERYGWAVVAVLMSMVEIAPIKVNPWSAILKYIGGKLNGDLQKDVQDLKTEVQGMKEDIQGVKNDVQESRKQTQEEIRSRMQAIDSKIDAVKDSSLVIEAKQSRVRILRFDEELLKGEEHTKEHFSQILDDIDLYEQYCESHEGFKNGIARHAIKHIRDTYDELEKKRAFYKEQSADYSFLQ